MRTYRGATARGVENIRHDISEGRETVESVSDQEYADMFLEWGDAMERLLKPRVSKRVRGFVFIDVQSGEIGLLDSNQSSETTTMKVFSKLLILFTLIPFISSCATQWEAQGIFFKKIQGQITVQGERDATVHVNNDLKGISPGTYPVEYEQEVKRKVRRVTFWETNPSLSLLLSILSLGIYIPFSLIPAQDQFSYEEVESYRNNSYMIRIEKRNCKKWEKSIILTKENKSISDVILKCDIVPNQTKEDVNEKLQ